MQSAFFSQQKLIRYLPLFAVIAALLFLIATPDVMAGDGGQEFDDVWTTLKDWTQGTLGRIIAGAIIVVGVVYGVARQSLIAFAVGIAGGMGLYQSPNIIESVMTASYSECAPMFEVLSVAQSLPLF